jgi:hypothetical protein
MSTRPVSVYAVLTRGSLDERKWEPLRKTGTASDLPLDRAGAALDRAYAI